MEEISGDKQKPIKKTKSNKKQKIMFFITIIAFLGLVTFLIITMAGDDEIKNVNKKSVTLSEEAKLQRATYQKEKLKEQREANDLQDSLLKEFEKKEESGKSEQILDDLEREEDKKKRNDLEQLLRGDKKEIESKKEESLNDVLNTSTVGSKNRDIYGKNDQDAIRNDYDLEHKTAFAYSRSYKKATYFDETKVKEMKKSKNLEVDPYMQRVDKLMDTIQQTARGQGADSGNIKIKPGEKPDININRVSMLYNDYPPVKVNAGGFIEAITTHKLISDREESPLEVKVRKDFLTDDGKYVIFPTGTRISGKSQIVDYMGQDKLYVWFERIVFPNKSVMKFPKSSYLMGLDKEGILGISSRVNRHFIMKYGSAIFAGVLDALSGLAQREMTPYSGGSNMTNRSSRNFQQINQSIFKQYSNIVPTITVDPGYRLSIYLTCDLYVTPYKPTSKMYYYNKNKR